MKAKILKILKFILMPVAAILLLSVIGGNIAVGILNEMITDEKRDWAIDS